MFGDWLDIGFPCSVVTVTLLCFPPHPPICLVFILTREFSDFCFCCFLPISHWGGGGKVNCPLQRLTAEKFSKFFFTTHQLPVFASQKILQSGSCKCFYLISWKSKNLSCYIAFCSGPLKSFDFTLKCLRGI